MRQPGEPADPRSIEAPKDLADEKKECVVLDMDTIVVQTFMLGHVPVTRSVDSCAAIKNGTDVLIKWLALLSLP